MRELLDHKMSQRRDPKLRTSRSFVSLELLALIILQISPGADCAHHVYLRWQTFLHETDASCLDANHQDTGTQSKP